MSNIKKDIAGVNRAIICKGCGKRVGFIKLKPALQELLDKKNRKQTWFYIFLIALGTQLIAQIMSDLTLKSFGL